MVNHFLASRCPDPELMDLRRPPREQLEHFYRFLRFVNATLGGTRAIRRALEDFSIDWPKDRPLWILDVATGSADVPRALVAWARAKGFRLKVVGIDREADTLALARRHVQGYPEILLVQAAAQALPFFDGHFDYVISNLFFHHLKDGEAVSLLRQFDRLARRGIVVNDLVRRRRLYRWTHLLSLFCNPPLRYDNLLSVRKSFTLSEARSLIYQAGLRYLTVRAVFGHRFILAGAK